MLMEENNEELDYDAIMERLAAFKKDEEEKRAKLEKVKQELVAAERLYHQLNREKNQTADSIREDVAGARELEKLAAKALRLKSAKEKRDALLADYNEKAKELDSLTATAQWREFAFDHQIEGGKRLAIAKRGILGDKRGLGKTLTSLIYLDMVQARKVLVVAPNDVVPQFEEEIQHWATHRNILSFRGLNKGQRTVIYPMLKMLDAFVITINYEAWRRDKSVIDDLVAAGIDTIVLDEAHRAKSSTKITARGIFQVAFAPNYCPDCGAKGLNIASGVSTSWVQGKKLVDAETDYVYRCINCGGVLDRTVKNVLSMTGTPIINKPQELFTMLHLVDPSRFPDERSFLQDYCYASGPGRWKFLPGGLERLTNSMSEFFVQRNREDAGIHIPPPAINIHYLDMDPIGYPAQYKAYNDLRNAAALVLEDGTAISMLYILEIILRERQCMTWPAGIILKDPETKEIIANFDVHESQKLDAVTELLGELLEEEERVIVFSKFKAPLYELKRRLEPNFSVTTATGDDPRYHKDQVRQDFDLKTAPAKPRWGAVFATYDAFATGVNLNAARHVIMVDDEWSPGMEDQAIGRIDRLNSVDQANVHIFRVRKSIDEFMEDLIEEKRKLTEGFEANISAKDMLNHLRGI